jgi:hypothetical protein
MKSMKLMKGGLRSLSRPFMPFVPLHGQKLTLRPFMSFVRFMVPTASSESMRMGT